jgi:aspartate carbamoyltransferase catalytic subunit
MHWGVEVFYQYDEALKGADVIMILRLQLERQEQSLIPTLREYSTLYGLTARRLAMAKDDVLVMHPGPINRGIEISPEVADGLSSAILSQTTNGVAVRMAVLYLLSMGARADGQTASAPISLHPALGQDKPGPREFNQGQEA